MVAGNMYSSEDFAITYIDIHFGNYEIFNKSTASRFPLLTLLEVEVPQTDSLSGDVLVLDVNADMKLDLFGMQRNRRMYWINLGDGHLEP